MDPPTIRHRPALGRAGTTTAYRKGCRCAKCTAANTQAKRRNRERRKQRGSRPLLTLVTEETVRPCDTTDGPEGQHHVAPPARPAPDSAWGPAEKALRADISGLPDSTDFGRQALIQGAIALTRQIDDFDFRGSKGPLVKTLVETIQAIRGKEADDGDTLEGLLAGLSEPFAGPAAGDAP